MNRGRAGLASAVLSLACLLDFAGVSLAATPANVTVALAPAAIVANGTSTSLVTGTVTDTAGVGISGETVWLSAPADPGISFRPNPATTDSNGDYSSTLTGSLTPGAPVVLAADGLAAVHPAVLTLLAGTVTSLTVIGGSNTTTNQPVTLVSTVTSLSSHVVPAGTVTFENQGMPIAGCASVPIPTQAYSSVSVTCETSFGASISPEQLSAVFNPLSGSLSISAGSPLATLAVTPAPTLTTVTSSTARVKFGAPVTFTAHVTQQGPGPLAPSGAVAFAADGRVVGACRTIALTASSAAACTVTPSSLGAHTASVLYEGDGNFAPSASDPATVVVEALGTVSATMQWTFFSTSRYTQVLALAVNGAPARASIRLGCRGRDCPIATKSMLTAGTRQCRVRPRRSCGLRGSIDLARWLRGRRLSVGTRITVQILKPGWIGKEYVFIVRSRRSPHVAIGCLQPGSQSSGGAC